MTRNGILGICIVMGTIGGALLLARGAQAFPASCSDPCLGDYEDALCDPNGNDVCWEGGSPDRIVCDEFGNGTDEQVFAYEDTTTGNGTSGNAIIFGSSDGDLFCCYFDAADHLVVETDSGDDFVCLNSNKTACTNAHEDNTCTWGADYYWGDTTVIRTEGGDDYVYGSPYSDSAVCDETTGDWCDDIVTGSCNATSGYGDWVYADAGPDRVVADPSDEDCGHRFYGEAGNDKLIGSDAADFLDGGLGGNVVVGGAEDDLLIGGELSDFLNGGLGQDSIWGGNDDDIVCGSSLPDGVVDFLYPGSGAETNGDVCATYLEDDDVDNNCESWRERDPYACPGAPF